jgi:hypothetical protein
LPDICRHAGHRVSIRWSPCDTSNRHVVEPLTQKLRPNRAQMCI